VSDIAAVGRHVVVKRGRYSSSGTNRATREPSGYRLKQRNEGALRGTEVVGWSADADCSDRRLARGNSDR
jgi:hypothetical protein